MKMKRRNVIVYLLVLFLTSCRGLEYELYQNGYEYSPESNEGQYDGEQQQFYTNSRDYKRGNIPKGIVDGEYSSFMKDEIKDDDDIIEEVKDSPSVFDDEDNKKKHLIIDSNALRRQVLPMANVKSEFVPQEFVSNDEKVSTNLEPVDTDIVEETESEFSANNRHRSHDKTEAEELTADFLARSKPAPIQSSPDEPISDVIEPKKDVSPIESTEDSEFIEPPEQIKLSHSDVNANQDNNVDENKVLVPASDKNEFQKPEENEAITREFSNLDWIKNDDNLNDGSGEEPVDEEDHKSQRSSNANVNDTISSVNTSTSNDTNEFNNTSADINPKESKANYSKESTSEIDSEFFKDAMFYDKDDSIDETKVNALAKSIGDTPIDDSSDEFSRKIEAKLNKMSDPIHEFVGTEGERDNGGEFIVEPNDLTSPKHKVSTIDAGKLSANDPAQDHKTSGSDSEKLHKNSDNNEKLEEEFSSLDTADKKMKPKERSEFVSVRSNSTNPDIENQGKNPEEPIKGVIEPVQQLKDKDVQSKGVDSPEPAIATKELKNSNHEASLNNGEGDEFVAYPSMEPDGSDKGDSTSDFYDTAGDKELSGPESKPFQSNRKQHVKVKKLVSQNKEKIKPEQGNEEVLKDDSNAVPMKVEDATSPDVTLHKLSKPDSNNGLDYYDTYSDKPIDAWPLPGKDPTDIQNSNTQSNYLSENKHTPLEHDEVAGKSEFIENTNEKEKENEFSNTATEMNGPDTPLKGSNAWPLPGRDPTNIQNSNTQGNYLSEDKHTPLEDDDVAGKSEFIENTNEKEKETEFNNTAKEMNGPETPLKGSHSVKLSGEKYNGNPLISQKDTSAQYEFKTSNVPQLRQKLNSHPRHNHKQMKLHLGEIGALETPEGTKVKFRFVQPSKGPIALHLLSSDQSSSPSPIMKSDFYDTSKAKLIYKPTVRMKPKPMPLKYISLDDSFPELDRENLSKKNLGENVGEENDVKNTEPQFKDLEEAVQEASQAISHAKDSTPKAVDLTNAQVEGGDKASPSLIKSVQMALNSPENLSDQKVQILGEDSDAIPKTETQNPSPTAQIIIPTTRPRVSVTPANNINVLKVNINGQNKQSQLPESIPQYHDQPKPTRNHEDNTINEEITLEDQTNEFASPTERRIDSDKNSAVAPDVKKPKPAIKPAANKPAEKTYDKPGDKPADKPAEKVAEKSLSKPVTPSKDAGAVPSKESDPSNTAAKNVMITIRLLEEQFDARLEKVESDQFQQLREKLQHAILEIYVDDDTFLSTSVSAFKASPKVPSTLADINLYFSTRLVNHLAKLETQIKTGKLGSMAVENSFLKITVLPDQIDVTGKCTGFCPNAAQCFPSCSQMCCGVFTSGIQPPPSVYPPPPSNPLLPPIPPPAPYPPPIPPPMPAYITQASPSQYYGQPMLPAPMPAAFESSPYNGYRSRYNTGYQQPYFRGYVYPKTNEGKRRQAIQEQKQTMMAQRQAQIIQAQANYNAYSRSALAQRGLLKPCGNGCSLKCSPRCAVKCCAYNR